jgi:hypothetical protein
MNYYVTNLADLRETYTFSSSNELENPYEVALNVVGYELDHRTDDGKVHEYVLRDRETKRPVFNFMEYMYYRACFVALSELGYDCSEEPYNNTTIKVS